MLVVARVSDPAYKPELRAQMRGQARERGVRLRVDNRWLGEASTVITRNRSLSKSSILIIVEESQCVIERAYLPGKTRLNTVLNVALIVRYRKTSTGIEVFHLIEAHGRDHRQRAIVGFPFDVSVRPEEVAVLIVRWKRVAVTPGYAAEQ